MGKHRSTMAVVELTEDQKTAFIHLSERRVRMVSYLLSIGHKQLDVEEVIDDAIDFIVYHIDRFDGTKKTLQSYCIMKIKQRLIDLHRKKLVRRKYDSEYKYSAERVTSDE